MPLTAAQVLQDIKAELAQPTSQQPVLMRQLAEARQQMQQFRAHPVLGALAGLKKLVYGLSHSTFSQQYNINDTLLNLIEGLYYEIKQQHQQQTQKLAQLELLLTPMLQSQTDNPTQFLAQLENLITPHRAGDPQNLQRIYSAPVEMSMPERVALYSFIYGRKPHHCLEIGTFRGGSSLIICGAMEDNGFGKLVCVDPKPQIAPETWQSLQNHTTLIEGTSPAVLAQAAAASGAPFDFALIDGDHSYNGALQDIIGTLPFLANQAYLMFHDSHYFEVKEAINAALQQYPQLTDCGEMSVWENPQTDEWGVVNGRQVIWGGLRLLRFQQRS